MNVALDGRASSVAAILPPELKPGPRGARCKIRSTSPDGSRRTGQRPTAMIEVPETLATALG